MIKNDNKRKNSNHRNRKFSEVSHDRNKKSDKGKDRKYEKSTYFNKCSMKSMVKLVSSRKKHIVSMMSSII